MRTLFFIVAMIMTTLPAKAATGVTKGFYGDVQAGWGRINETLKHFKRRNMSGFAFNGNLGYRINRFWGVETGYYHFPDNNFHYGVKGRDNNAIALNLKAIAPFDNGINIIGKIGAAASNHTLSPKVVPGVHKVKGAGSHTENVFLLGLGTSYSLTDHLAIALQGTGLGNAGAVPAKIMATMGFTYTL